jgi:hypothetical protein
LRIGDETFDGTGRVVEPDTDEDTLARRLLEEKYSHTMDLTRWLRESLPVAIDLP